MQLQRIDTKMSILKIAQKVAKHLGYFCKKIRFQCIQKSPNLVTLSLSLSLSHENPYTLEIVNHSSSSDEKDRESPFLSLSHTLSLFLSFFLSLSLSLSLLIFDCTHTLSHFLIFFLGNFGRLVTTSVNKVSKFLVRNSLSVVRKIFSFWDRKIF